MTNAQLTLMAKQRAARLARDAALPKPASKVKRASVARNGKSQAEHMIDYLQTLGPMTADQGAELYEGDTQDGLPRDMSQTCSKLLKDGVVEVIGMGVSRFGSPASVYRLK